MRLIVIEDNETIISSIKEVIELDFDPADQDRVIFIKSVAEIDSALGASDIKPGEKYMVILDHRLPDGTSIEAIESLKDHKNVWDNITTIYGFSSTPETQEEIVRKEFGSSIEAIYKQSGKGKLFSLLTEISKVLKSGEGEEQSDEFARAM
jgi:DNA-binding NarL/FixJ family response regulator